MCYPIIETEQAILSLQNCVIHKQVDVDNDHTAWVQAAEWEKWDALAAATKRAEDAERDRDELKDELIGNRQALLMFADGIKMNDERNAELEALRSRILELESKDELQ